MDIMSEIKDEGSAILARFEAIGARFAAHAERTAAKEAEHVAVASGILDVLKALTTRAQSLLDSIPVPVADPALAPAPVDQPAQPTA